jgi:hypothetical protein
MGRSVAKNAARRNCKCSAAERLRYRRADASKISAIKILLAFWLDTELLLIKITAPPFAAISSGGAEFYLAVFEGSRLVSLVSGPG